MWCHWIVNMNVNALNIKCLFKMWQMVLDPSSAAEETQLFQVGWSLPASEET